VSAPNEDAQANAVALQPDGKILAGGFSGLADAAHFMLVRLTPAGSLDTAFGNAGKVAPAFPAPAFGEYGVSLLVQADGRVVLGGYRDLNPSGASTLDFAFAMARVWQ
jgi:uncharacterized delta-60 repeat protein